MAFTYFLRDLHTLERVVEHVVPYTSGRSRVQVWDAGCAMGQEPYSLAMLFAENMGSLRFQEPTNPRDGPGRLQPLWGHHTHRALSGRRSQKNAKGAVG